MLTVHAPRHVVDDLWCYLTSISSVPTGSDDHPGPEHREIGTSYICVPPGLTRDLAHSVAVAFLAGRRYALAEVRSRGETEHRAAHGCTVNLTPFADESDLPPYLGIDPRE